jgi:hypothetical protein
MWTCPKCGEKIEDQFDSCWHCETPRPVAGSETPASPNPPAAANPSPVKWRAKYQMFRGTLATWEDLFGEAAQFATKIGPERLITISHSEDGGEGVVAVWYWSDEISEAP